MKRLLFYLTRFPGYGGIETVTEIVGTKLFELGCEISIVTHISDSRESFLINKSHLYVMPEKRKWDCKKNRRFIDEICNMVSFDAIIYQDSYAPTHNIVLYTAEKYNVPLFVFEHNTPLYGKKSRENTSQTNSIRQIIRKKILFPYEDWEKKRRRLKLLEKCKKYILLSDSFKEDFDAVIGNDNYAGREKIISIHNPITVNKYKCQTRKEDIVLYVGRLVRTKRVTEMLYMWKIIENKHPDWRFIIVGDGPERHNLQTLVNKESLRNVYVEGYANPTIYYQKSKIFWMTSAYEGWGMTLVEAMQQGCVPIAYNTFSSLVDIINNGKNGFAVENNKKDAFINTTCNLIDNNELWEKMSQNAILKSKEYNIDCIIHEWQKLLGI